MPEGFSVLPIRLGGSLQSQRYWNGIVFWNAWNSEMKIKVESEKIINAVKKLDGIEIVLENPDDAKEAINLILRKTDLFKGDDYGKLRGINVSSFQEYKTSAVDYKMIVLLEFLFEDNISLDTKVAVIKELQEFFGKV
jgi:copper chaperone CopZ